MHLNLFLITILCIAIRSEFDIYICFSSKEAK